MKQLFLGLALLLSAQAAWALTIATGSSEGTYYKIAQNIKEVATKDGVELNVLETHGSFENIGLLGKGQADLGIVQLDALKYFADVMRDEGGLDVFERLKVVLNLYPEEIHVLTRRKDVFSFYDLANKKVSVGPRNSGSALTAAVLFKTYDINAQQLHYTQAHALEELTQGNIDAMIFVAGAPVAAFKDLGGNFHLARLPKNPLLDTIYSRRVLGEESYSWMGSEIETYAVPSGIVTIDKQEDNQMVELGKLVLSVLNNKKHLEKTGHPKWRDADLLLVYDDVGYVPSNDIITMYSILDDLGYRIIKK